MKSLKFVGIKAVGHNEELQLITFFDNWENVEARDLHTRGVPEM